MADTKKFYVSKEKLAFYDEKIKKFIGDADAATLAAAKSHAEGLATNYDAAGAAATAKQEAIAHADAEIAKTNEAVAAAKTQADKGVADAATAQGAAEAAQSTADGAVSAIEDLADYVGEIPSGEAYADIETVIGYVNKKAEETLAAANGGSSESAATVAQSLETYKTENNAKVNKNIEDIAALQTALDEEIARAEGKEGENAAAIKAIADDYLKAADKTELQGNIDTVAGAVERLTNGVSAEEVDGVNDLIQYVKDHGTEVTGMQGDIADNAAAIEGVAGRMTDAEGNITALQGAVATKVEKSAYDEKIAALEGADTALSNRIDELFGEGEGTVGDMISDAISAERALIDAEIAKKVDKVDGKGLSTNDLTNELKGQYDAAYTHSQEAHAPANAQANIIESVKVNGAALTITDKAVDIAVPTDNAQLANGAGYLVASDIANKADKATTLSGYGITDAYTTAQVDGAIAAAIGQFEEISEGDINALFA